MTDKQDGQHNQYTHHDICSIGHKACGQRVEDQCQHTTRQTDGEESDVGEHVAQNTRYIIIGIPQSRAKVHKRILSGRVEEEHQHCTQAKRCVERRRRCREEWDNSCLIEHRQTHRYACRCNDQEPAECCQSVLETDGLRDKNHLQNHTEENLHQADG